VVLARNPYTLTKQNGSYLSTRFVSDGNKNNIANVPNATDKSITATHLLTITDIPKRSNQKRRGKFNRGLYRDRNLVERLINRIKQYRRIATLDIEVANCLKIYFINQLLQCGHVNPKPAQLRHASSTNGV
jgi:hypothetical protein